MSIHHIQFINASSFHNNYKKAKAAPQEIDWIEWNDQNKATDAFDQTFPA